MPRAVTPWLTAFKAYSTLCYSQLPIQQDPSARSCLIKRLSSIAEHRRLLTNLHQLSTTQSLLEQEVGKQTEGTTDEADIPGGESCQREGVSVRHDARMHDLVLNEKSISLAGVFQVVWRSKTGTWGEIVVVAGCGAVD